MCTKKGAELAMAKLALAQATAATAAAAALAQEALVLAALLAQTEARSQQAMPLRQALCLPSSGPLRRTPAANAREVPSHRHASMPSPHCCLYL